MKKKSGAGAAKKFAGSPALKLMLCNVGNSLEIHIKNLPKLQEYYILSKEINLLFSTHENKRINKKIKTKV